MTNIILVHYNEIAIKGNNRRDFENQLVLNIKEKIGKLISKIYKQESRVLIEYDSNEEEIINNLKKVFGISSFGVGKKLEREEKLVCNYLKENRKLFEGKTIKVETKRSDKSFPVNSMEFSKKIGEYLFEELKANVDLKNPEIVINIEILKDSFIIFLKKEPGLGGLPVGSAGRVLCLLSGGIDSPVAAWMMMKRGCVVDFLHVAPFDPEAVKKSKISRIVKKLEEYGNRGKLYIVSYENFFKQVENIEPKYRLIMFRRFIYSLAEKICEKEEILGIVSGDSVGQVASQTLENLFAATSGIKVPIYRPVVGMDKNEIIALSERIGLRELSQETYVDCCALVAIKHPATKAKKEKVEEICKKIEIEKIIEKSLEKTKEIK